ncbi:arginine vasopressin-induced protein 1-like isoform X1 [Rhinatrema bivittatum]|uniref:arginine vasopressin-induced protein 1-like isoform X1 n=2 Tax=Rhinatrema bivittatum TaxID=194408 RepID=UPI00112682FC|nr:arginine vasopressin-induced protein 1-like isoform X1 [Rhinatrema bivittatum]
MGEQPRRTSLQNQEFSSLKSMGTPASVACEPPLPWQASEPRARKKASANIFQDIDLLQIQGLFQNSGDKRAQERAQIVWDCAGDRRLAEALMQLRRRRRTKRSRRIRLQQRTVRARSKSIGTLSIHHFSQLCIEDGTEEHQTPPSQRGRDGQSSGTWRKAAAQRVVRNRRQNGHQGPLDALHQIRH